LLPILVIILPDSDNPLSVSHFYLCHSLLQEHWLFQYGYNLKLLWWSPRQYSFFYLLLRQIANQKIIFITRKIFLKLCSNCLCLFHLPNCLQKYIVLIFKFL